LGISAGTWEDRLLIRALVIAFIPVIWGVSQVVERLTGRDMWHLTAPYPYRWMRERGETALPRPHAVPRRIECTVETDDRSTLPLAA
jgi:hypothetical protein